MTTDTHRDIALPTRNRTQVSLPGSLPSKTATPAPGLPGALPAKTGTRPASLPSTKTATTGLPPRTARTTAPATTSLPSKALPTVAPKTDAPKTAGSLPVMRKTAALPVPQVSTPVVSTPDAGVADDVFGETIATNESTARTVDERQITPVPTTKRTPAQYVPVASTTPNLNVPSPKPKVKKRRKAHQGNKGFRPTTRDREILGLIYRYTLLTAPHLAFYFEASPDTIRKSLTRLFNQGLIDHDDRASRRVWQITNLGIDFIREKGKAPKKFPSHMKFHHTLCIATVGLILEKGGKASLDLTENVLSEAPRVFITEREMLVMEARRERNFLRTNWDRLTADLLHDENYPANSLRFHTEDVFAYLESKGLSVEEQHQKYQVMVANETAQKTVLNERWRGNATHTGYCHLVTSNNPSITKTGGAGSKTVTYATSHRPDGLIAMPHIIDADGVVRGGSIAVEVELNNKATKQEYVNTILHQWHHPAYDGVFWFFDDPEAKRMFKEAMKMLSERFNPPFTLEEARAYFKPLSLRYLNDDNHGTYG